MTSHHQPQHLTASPGQTYFDLDGDTVLHSKSSEEEDVPLTWRGNPSETMADSTLVIVTSELKTVTYHVHKNVLCFGPRQSKLFGRHMLNRTPDKKNRKHKQSSSSSVISSKSNSSSSTKKKKKRKQSSSSSISSSKSNSNNSTSIKVELDQRDADNVPILLDFIYASRQSHNISSNGTVLTAASTFTSTVNSTITGFTTVPTLFTVPTDDDCSLILSDDVITTSNAVSLRHLARTFEVDAFMMAVNKFIQKDLSFKTGPGYLTQAFEYKDERLVESAKRLCAENFEQIDVKALTKLPHNLFRVVIRSLESYSSETDNRQLSQFTSEVVCRYLEKHPERLSAQLLLELTDPLLMPYLASEAAIGFTALVKELDPQDAKQHWDGLVELCRRSANTVVQEYGWNDFSVTAAVDEYLNNSHSPDSMQAVSRLDSLLFATSFAAALEQAQDDYEQVVVEQERLENMVHSLVSSVTNLERGNQRKDDMLMRQQGAIDEAKKQILALKQQIGEIKQQQLVPQQRPPVAHASTQAEPRPTLQLASPVRELISPSENLQTKRELRTKSEMRAKSLL